MFVYWKGVGNVNICDSLRNNGKQNYPENTVRAICRIACCIDSALKVNCLQVQQQSNSIDYGVFATTFAVDVCFGLPPNERNYDVLKCGTVCQHVCNYRNYHLFRRFQGGFQVADFFNGTLTFFCVCRQNFFMSDTKDSVDSLMARCSICYEWHIVTSWLDVVFVMSGI